MAKVGRPKKEDSRKHDLHLRLNDDELYELERCCSETGISKSEIIRKNLRMVCNLARHQSGK